MKISLGTRGAVAIAAALIVPAAALAQAAWVPGSEITGQAVQVETNGISNTVYFDPGGAARIISPAGRVVQANWTAANQQLCLSTGGASECWPYAQPFQAGQQVVLTSNCNSVSRFLATATNEAPTSKGERG